MVMFRDGLLVFSEGNLRSFQRKAKLRITDICASLAEIRRNNILESGNIMVVTYHSY